MPLIAPPMSLRPTLAVSALAASLWLLPCTGLAFAVRDVPDPRRSHSGWVADSANILRVGTVASINAKVDALERRDGSEVMLVTVPDTSESTSPKSFATELFNAIRIGKQGVDNGVLILVSKDDRRVEIETGYGMEDRLPDTRVGTIIETVMLPRFRLGDFDGGTLAGVDEIIGALSTQTRDHEATAHKQSDLSGEWLRFWVFLITLYGIFILFFAYLLIRNRLFSSDEPSFAIGEVDSAPFTPDVPGIFFASGSNCFGNSIDSSGGGSSGGGGGGGSW